MKKHTNINAGLSTEAVDSVVLGLENSEEEIQETIRFVEAAQQEESNKTVEIVDFSALSIEDVFAPYTHYRLYNSETRRDFLINGVVLDAKVGLDYALREKLFDRKVSTFKLENSVIVFYKSIKENVKKA